jgi:hypothetical protein
MIRYSILSFLLLSCVTSLAQWNGNPNPVVGQTYLYSYNDGTVYWGDGWSIDKGTYSNPQSSGTNYTVSVTWTAVGSGSVSFLMNGGVVSSFPVTISPACYVTGGAVGSDQTICSGGNPAAFTQSTASTGSGTLSYQWQSSLNNSTFTDIGGATASIYDPPSGLSQTTYYKRVTTNTLNGATCTATSNTITVTVNSVTGGGVGSAQTICSGGDPVAFTQSTASTGSGTLSYQWQSSLNNSTFTDIGGATATTYDPPSGLSQTTYYKRLTRSILNSVACTATSNTITVTVNSVTGGGVGSAQTICSGGDPVAFTQSTCG